MTEALITGFDSHPSWSRDRKTNFLTMRTGTPVGKNECGLRICKRRVRRRTEHIRACFYEWIVSEVSISVLERRPCASIESKEGSFSLSRSFCAREGVESLHSDSKRDLLSSISRDDGGGKSGRLLGTPDRENEPLGTSPSESSPFPPCDARPRSATFPASANLARLITRLVV